MHAGVTPSNQVLIPAHIQGAALARGEILGLAGQTMGTTWSLRWVAQVGAPDRGAAATLGVHLQNRLDELVASLSHWLPDSELSRYNRACAQSWHAMSEDFFAVLSTALDVAGQTNGAFDPTLGALVAAWGFGPEPRYSEGAPIAPDAGHIDALRKQAGWHRLALDRTHRQVYQPGGISLDFSGIAKGYAVDQIAQLLEKQGVRHYLLEVGGELRAAGMKPDAQPWWVALELPPHEGIGLDFAPSVLALHELAVASSGDYLRCYFENGQRRAHTLDARTGQPLTNELAAVTVIHADCMLADAYATALMVLGVEAGLQLADRLGLAARFIERLPHGLRESGSRSYLALRQ